MSCSRKASEPDSVVVPPLLASITDWNIERPEFDKTTGREEWRPVPFNPANLRESLHELELDIAEGADIVMVKPAGPYLDVLADVAAASPVPVAAYQVSGEYAMVEAAAQRGWIDRERVIAESVLGIVRAGADMVLTYWAREIAENSALH